MKKRISNHPLKKILACCGLILTLISICVPCFAQEPILVNGNYYWGSISDTPTDEQIGYFYSSSGFTTAYVQSIYNDYYNTTATAYLVDIVKKQYDIGLFGGNVPVAISIRAFGPASDNIRELHTRVYCVRQSDIAIMGEEKSYADIGVYRVSDTQFQEKNGFRMDYYDIYINGDVEWAGRTADSIITSSNGISAGSRMVATYDNGYWINGGNGHYASYWTTSTSVPVSYTNIMSLYDETEKQPQYITNNYELDIPSIITAIPNGAKQIINNAFGFEIFGINVAGFLSVLLIVAIVSFVIKKLIK